MGDSFSNTRGVAIIFRMIKDIQENKQYLSDIDGLIGDGDHGINMNKGFTMCEERLTSTAVNLGEGLKLLSDILMMKIGGSMGPLYGLMFKAMSKEILSIETIDAKAFSRMLAVVPAELKKITKAQPGDKTLMDCLVPAVNAFEAAVNEGNDFTAALTKMKEAAIHGRDSTKNMLANDGRSSRLGERSVGVIDAGAASCCIILCSTADCIVELLQ